MEQVKHIEEHRDDEASKLGMWLFIFTELLLFGGLFLVYSVYRSQYFEAFKEGSEELNVFIGTLNTIFLLVSSMTVAMSLTALQKNDKVASLRYLAITLAFAAAFLVNKYFEWGAKFHHGLYPGSDMLMELDRGHLLYFGLYFFMSGLHALHIIVGMVILAVVYMKIKNNKLTSDNFVLLENGALYWHLVDLIWIFLFPLLYLIT